ncbi:PREDICTED: collagen alpha-1(IX) chain-like, partial [Merops nubicus]|uniref:collagen alpha-1(IX) chain-like n=1 Tax=Merops nubicus TaxID=57421 RepID=UPI0004F0AC24
MKSDWKITAFFYVCSFLWTFISATIQHQSRLPVILGASQRSDLCPTIRIGQDDLPGFDLISQFQIEKAASQGIIQRVVGSTPLQVAYKLGPNVDFRIPTSAIYSNGLPDEYSFLTTFRMTGATLQKYWTIWQIQDSSGKEQVGVNLNGQIKSVEFSYKGADGSLQTASFLHLPFLFDSQWHKLMISVEADSITLFIDCIKIESLNTKPKGKISIDGFAVLGKLKNNPQISVPEIRYPCLKLSAKSDIINEHLIPHETVLIIMPLARVGSEIIILHPVTGYNAENILFVIVLCKESCFGENDIGGDIR